MSYRDQVDAQRAQIETLDRRLRELEGAAEEVADLEAERDALRAERDRALAELARLEPAARAHRLALVRFVVGGAVASFGAVAVLFFMTREPPPAPTPGPTAGAVRASADAPADVSAPAPLRTASVTFSGRVVAGEGEGRACNVGAEVAVRSAPDPQERGNLEVERVHVLCREPAGHFRRVVAFDRARAAGACEVRAAPSYRAHRTELALRCTIAAAGEDPGLVLDTEAGTARLTGLPPGVTPEALALAPLSGVVGTWELWGRGADTGGQPSVVRLEGAVTSTSGGTPVSRGDRCVAHLTTTTGPGPGDRCRLLVHCGEHRLFGGFGAGEVACRLGASHRTASGGHPVSAVDTDPASLDGDPQVTFQYESRELAIYDTVPGQERRVEIAIDAEDPHLIDVPAEALDPYAPPSTE